MKIVPALLTDKVQNLELMLSQVETFIDFVQIDFMDGSFVPSKSIAAEDMAGIRIHIGWEAHLMVQDPVYYLSSFNKQGLKRAIFHWEASPHPESIISDIRNLGLEVGLAVNPETSFSDFERVVAQIDAVLFLTVHPGFYGSPFIPEVLEKIEDFRSHFPSKLIGVDGGISLENIQKVRLSGADYACVGSRIFRHEDPRQSYEEFARAIE